MGFECLRIVGMEDGVLFFVVEETGSFGKTTESIIGSMSFQVGIVYEKCSLMNSVFYINKRF